MCQQDQSQQDQSTMKTSKQCKGNLGEWLGRWNLCCFTECLENVWLMRQKVVGEQQGRCLEESILGRGYNKCKGPETSIRKRSRRLQSSYFEEGRGLSCKNQLCGVSEGVPWFFKRAPQLQKKKEPTGKSEYSDL